MRRPLLGPSPHLRPRPIAAFLIVALVALAPGPAAAQLLRVPGRHPAHDSAKDTTSTRHPDVGAPDSPRASLAAFLQLTAARQFRAAAAYLDIPDSLRRAGAGTTLARELAAVLDRHLTLDLDAISGAPMGDTTDGLPRDVEQIGIIPAPTGARWPVRLVREWHGGEMQWVFSRSTVSRVPAWYDALDDRWALEHLPPVLLRTGPLDLLWWQWMALPLLIALAWLIGSIAGRLVRAGLARAAKRTAAEWDDALIGELGGPLTLALAIVAGAAFLPWLALYPPAAQTMQRVVRAGFFLVFFWALWRMVDVGRQLLAHSHWAHRSTGLRALLPIMARAAKVAVLAITAVAVLSVLGYPVAGLITGLGLGGLAFALAAQKTVENLFGAVSIGIDQPFREGDFVKIEDFVGTVEVIGLRSTRIRTLDRTIITMPNGKLADMRVESFAARDRLRLAATIGLVYETTAAQMREVLAGFEGVLRAHPKIWPDAVVVRFSAFSASSLDIDIMAWFQTADWGEFQLIRQEILLQFMEVVERAGTSFAFPTQTVHLVPEAHEARYPGSGERDGGGVPVRG